MPKDFKNSSIMNIVQMYTEPQLGIRPWLVHVLPCLIAKTKGLYNYAAKDTLPCCTNPSRKPIQEENLAEWVQKPISP